MGRSNGCAGEEGSLPMQVANLPQTMQSSTPKASKPHQLVMSVALMVGKKVKGRKRH